MGLRLATVIAKYDELTSWSRHTLCMLHTDWPMQHTLHSLRQIDVYIDSWNHWWISWGPKLKVAVVVVVALVSVAVCLPHYSLWQSFNWSLWSSCCHHCCCAIPGHHHCILIDEQIASAPPLQKKCLGPINGGWLWYHHWTHFSYLKWHCSNLFFWKGKGQVPFFFKAHHPSTEILVGFSGIRIQDRTWARHWRLSS